MSKFGAYFSEGLAITLAPSTQQQASRLVMFGPNMELDSEEEKLHKIAQERNGDEINKANKSSENVMVMVRCRPFLDKKRPQEECLQRVRVDELDKCIEIDDRSFYFDYVFGQEANNELVYMKSARQLVESAFLGYNCTIFLYGQTGTGKTFTHSSLTSSSFAHIFSLIQDSNKQARFLIRASYYELYNEEIRDLLVVNSAKSLELRESKERGVYIKDLSSYLVNNLQELEKLKRIGDKQRSTASTNMNEHSSRSHSIFTITIEAVDTIDSSKTVAPIVGNNLNKQAPNSKNTPKPMQSRKVSQIAELISVRVGRLNLIDLAGSERQSKSGSSGTRLKEASRINLSLTCLSLVIRALTDPSSTHVPYRNSKLTRLLSSSLGGNSKTLLIACISAESESIDETLNTLRFAQRTKKIKNEAKINEDPKDALLRRYKQQVEELRSKLRSQQLASGRIGAKNKSNSWKQDGDTGNFVNDEEAINSLISIDKANTKDEPKSDLLKQEELAQQLRLLKSKIVVGGVNLLEKAEMHDRLLEASRQELEEKRLEEGKLKEQLETKRKLIEQMAQSKEGLEGEVVNLDEKLKRVLVLYKQTKEEQRDMASDHEQLREQLLQTIRATNKEIKFANCIIDDFIPGK